MPAIPLDSPTADASRSPRHFGFISGNLPLWLLHASPQARQRYFELAKRSARSAHNAAAAIHGLRAPHEFARPLLEQSLKLELGLELNVDQLQFLKFVTEGRFLIARRKPEMCSLLDAALKNFEQDEDFGPGAALLPKDALHFDYNEDWELTWRYSQSAVAPVTASGFAAHCRTLNLGRRYQTYLAASLDDKRVQLLLETNFMDSLAVHAQVAWLRGHLQAPGLAFIEGLAQKKIPLWDGQTVEACSLTLLVTLFRSGYELVGPLVFKQVTGSPACIVFIPDDPECPLKEYPSLEAFSDGLRERLRSASYRAFFRRFVAHAEQWAFCDRLLKTLNPWPLENRRHEPLVADPQADIGLRAYRLDGALAQSYRKRWHDRFLSDARTMAVPTEEVDRQARERLLEGYLQDGLTALGVAGLFVPGLGELMLGVGAGQILADIAIGIDDWQHGQMEEAIDHFASVAENAGMVLVFAAAGYGIRRSAFVENMTLVEDSQGRPRLWHGNLAGYEVEASEVEASQVERAAHDATGVLRKGEHVYVKVGHAFFAVEHTPQNQWRVLHPQNPSAYRPQLLRNPEGGWRFELERPLDWTEAELMRRWGPPVEGLTDEQLQRLQQVSDIPSARLRRCHVLNEPMPALLTDTLQRFRLDQEIDQVIRKIVKGEPIDPVYSVADDGLPWTTPRLRQLKGQLFEQAFETRQQAERAKGGALSRDFPGLPGAVVKEIIAQASDTERGLLFGHARVPLRMAEEARGYLNQLKLNRALLGFYCPDLETQETNTLRSVFRSRLPGQLPNRVSRQALNANLLDITLANRQEAKASLGIRQVQPWFRSPLRGGGQRPGFQLSGRGDASFSPNRRLQALYPSLDDTQLVQLREELALRGPLERVIAAREDQYLRLTAALDSWVEAPSTYLDANGQTVPVTQASRQAAADHISAAWRRETAARHGQDGRAYGFRLNLGELRLGSLPPLGVELDHIETLSLDDTQLTSDPREFLRAFPKLRSLSLAGNRLTAVPNIGQPLIGRLKQLNLSHNRLVGSTEAFAPLSQASALEDLLLEGNGIERLPLQWPSGAQLPQLQRLDLSSNGLTMDAPAWNRVGSLPGLRTLDLSNNAITLPLDSRNILARMSQLRQLHLHGNPLGVAPDLSALRELRVVSLGETQIGELPAGLVALMGQPDSGLLLVDLSGNQITDVPALPRLIRTPMSTAPYTATSLFFSLHGNPLSESSMEHLRQADPGFEVIRRLPAPAEAPLPIPRTEWADGASDDLRAAIQQARAMPSGEMFFAVLDRCVDTADYRVDPLGTRARMQAIAQAVTLPTGDGEGLMDLRDQLYSAAEDVSRTCGDGVSLVLQRFETLILAWRAASTALEGGAAMFRPLLEVSEQLFRQDLLDDAVMRISRSREQRYQAIRSGAAYQPRLSALDDLADSDLLATAPDEVELRLKARRALVVSLRLAPQPANQLYAADLSAQTLARLTDEVTDQATQEALLDWLLPRQYWGLYLEKVEAVQFQALQTHWSEVADYYEEATAVHLEGAAPLVARPAIVRQLEALLPGIEWRREGRLAPVTMTDQRYKEGFDLIAQSRSAAQEALIARLSQPLIRQHSTLPTVA